MNILLLLFCWPGLSLLQNLKTPLFIDKEVEGSGRQTLVEVGSVKENGDLFVTTNGD